MDTEARFLVWDTISMAWTEIGLETDDYPRIAERLKESGATWKEINQIAVKDVCASFASDTFLIFPCMLWMLMPDWGYDDKYLRERMLKWESRPMWFHFMNPLRLLGYPLAMLFSSSVRRRLRKAFLDANKRP